MTRSTAPMSMPSSSDDVATTARSSPDFSSASVSALSSLLTLPWWARAMSVAAVPARALLAIICAGSRRSGGLKASGWCSCAYSSLILLVRRSAVRRELTNTRVERAPMILSYTSRSMKGHTDPAGSATVAAAGSTASAPTPGVSDRSLIPKGSSTTASPITDPVSTAGMSSRSSTGTLTIRSKFFAASGATMDTGCPPPMNAATSSTGRTVADRPMR